MSKFIPPDWRDDSAYPSKVDDWSLGSWVWAFLRRNPEYQKDYEHFAALPGYHPNGGKTSKWCARSTHDLDYADFRYCKHPILPNETVIEYVTRTGDETPWHYSIEAHLMEKWEIHCIPDPAYDKGSHCISFDINLPKIIGEDSIYDEEKEELVLKEIEHGEFFEITLRFDLRYSIEKQLYWAKDCLLDYQKSVKERIRKTGINRVYLPKYLRAYDANQVGATNLEVAKYVYPERKVDSDHAKYDRNDARESDEQWGYRAVQKGKKLVNGGYKDLLKLF